MKSEARVFSAHDALFDIAPSVERAPVTDRIALLLDRTIYGTLLFTFVLFAVPYGAVEPWWVASFEIVIFALTALWMVEGALSGSWRISGIPLLLPLLALIVFAVIQAAPMGGISETAGIQFQPTLSVDPYETKRFALKLLALCLAGLLLRRYAASRRRASLLILTLIGVGIASAVFGLIRQTSQHEAMGFGLPFLQMGEGYAQFINRNHFAFLMEMTLGLAMGLVVGGGVRRDRVMIYLAAIAPLWTALVLSNSRGGIFSMLSQVLFIGLLAGGIRGRQPEAAHEDHTNRLAMWLDRLSRSRLARMALAFCLVLVLAVSMIWMGGDLLVNRLESLPQEVASEANASAANNAGENGSGERRAELWRATWSLIKTHPIAGSGFGAYKTAIPPHHRASGEMIPEEAHNDYLEILSSGGVIGFFLALLFIFLFIKTARQRLREADPIHRAACFGALTGLFGAAVHSLVDFGLHITINALVFTALAAIATLKLSEDSSRRGKPIR
jgi:O-antigen ligase